MKPIKTNLNNQSYNDVFSISWRMFLDAIVGTFTLGRYQTDYSTNQIIKVMTKNIEIRRARRELKVSIEEYKNNPINKYNAFL